MKIGMVLLDRDFPPDIRVEKEASSLLAAGHEVELLCRSERDRPMRSREGGLSVTRVAQPNGFARALGAFGYLLRFRHAWWRERAAAWARERAIEALHVHDLPLALTVEEVARRLGIAVVLDLHENYPAALRAWRRGRRRPVDVVFCRWERLPAVEIEAARRADRVIVVVEEGLERFRRAGLNDEKLVVVSNTEPLSFGDEVLALRRDSRYGDDIVLAYQGGFAADRGLESVIAAMPELLATGRPYRLVLAGDGDTLPDMKRLAERLGVAERVEFLGWIDMAAVKVLVASADVGLVPHLKNEHRETTVPHKLFQYMVSGKAVAVSDCAPLRRIVGEAECGVVVGGAAPAAWAEALTRVSDRRLAEEMGRRGRAACEAGLSWETDGARLVALYEELAAARGRGSAA